MISRTRGMFSTNLWKPKNIHSLDYLKYLYTVLSKNQNITDQNKEVLVEVFRLIAEILIWGDQNDSAIIDFFLEKNISSLFLKFMNQKNGKMIYKQLLQTLSIMFENISDNTSIYYLLSNNHINSIICHKFDFSDEEFMAYYISFLKALSMKLNKHTINFFYNEHTNDFALFTEAIKYFNQSESMVRTAVRNITLNVYKVVDKGMLKYIRDKTSVPYFHSLMWFIGSNIIDIDICIRNESDNQSNFSRLQGLVDEHLDHLHYINDILCLNVELLNDVLTDSLLNKLLIPLYIYSLSKRRPYSPDTDPRPHASYIVSMFLLSQVFLIIKHQSVVQGLTEIIFNGDLGMCVSEICESEKTVTSVRKFDSPTINLADTLDNIKGIPRPRSRELKSKTTEDSVIESDNTIDKSSIYHTCGTVVNSAPASPRHRHSADIIINDTSEMTRNAINHDTQFSLKSLTSFSLKGKPFLKAIFRAIDVGEGKQANDYNTLFSMCLLFSMCQNQGVDEVLLSSCGLTSKSLTKSEYNRPLMDKLIAIFNTAVKYGSPIRLITLELACIFVEILVCSRNQCWISDEHFAYILTSYEESKLLLRNYYKTEEIFVDMFEDEYMNIQKRPLNVEFLMMDSGILLPHATVKMSDFAKKLPTNDIERAKYAIRVFLLLRQLCEKLKSEDDIDDTSIDNSLIVYPFNTNVVSVTNKLDLTNRDLIACTVEYNNKSERRFLVVDEQQIILVEPDSKRVGWGVVTFVGFLQHIRISGSREDNKSLLINIYNHTGAIALKSQSLNNVKKPVPILAAKFIFDDHIRCMVAHKRLDKGKEMAHQLKLQQIALMLDFPTNVALGIKSPLTNNNKEYRSGYFGPKENIIANGKQKIVLEKSNSVTLSCEYSDKVKPNIRTNSLPGSSSLTELHIDKLLSLDLLSDSQ